MARYPENGKAKSATERKKAQRERQAKFGIKPVEVKLSENERNDLTRLCKIRGGVGGAYSAAEYISTLIRRDKELLLRQLTETHCCDACNNIFPDGPTGEIKHDASCWHPVGRKDLEL